MTLISRGGAIKKLLIIIVIGAILTVIAGMLLTTKGFAMWSGDAGFTLVVCVHNQKHDRLADVEVELWKWETDGSEELVAKSNTDHRGISVFTFETTAGGERTDSGGFTSLGLRQFLVRCRYKEAGPVELHLQEHLPSNRFDDDDWPFVGSMGVEIPE